MVEAKRPKWKPHRPNSIDDAQLQLVRYVLDFRDLDPLQEAMVPDGDAVAHDRFVKAAAKLREYLERREASLSKRVGEND